VWGRNRTQQTTLASISTVRAAQQAQRSRHITAQRTSSRILATTSGRSAMQWKVQVSTAAVVSCPAISRVMRSSRSCLEVMSSPVAGQGRGSSTVCGLDAFWAQKGQHAVPTPSRQQAVRTPTPGGRETFQPRHAPEAKRKCRMSARAQTRPGTQFAVHCRAHAPEAMRKGRLEGSALDRNSSTNSSSSSSTWGEKGRAGQQVLSSVRTIESGANLLHKLLVLLLHLGQCEVKQGPSEAGQQAQV